MPRKLKIEGLTAELASLNDLIKSAHDMDDPIGEYQLSKRKDSLQSELERLKDSPENKASVALFFGGKPVLGSRGISAEFAGNMLENFQNLVTRTFAATEFGMLGERGPVPKKQAADLMVTNLARGSFGFVLNELSDQEEMQGTALKAMVEDAVSILGKVSSSNDLDFEDAAKDLDSRMLNSLKDFFKTLDTAQATIRLVDDITDILLDQAAIYRARVRTEATSIDEEDVTVDGLLVGFLPDHRKFELRTKQLENIYGSVSRDASEQYVALIERGENPINKMWRARMRKRTVTPLNRQPMDVYRLLEFLEP